MSAVIATTIPQYLEQLRAELRGADPALVQDALYDAEEYLRSEWADNPSLDEAALLSSVAGSYGAPAEVAQIYRDTEATVVEALRPPAPRQRHSPWGRFFSVVADPLAYTSLLYMLLSLVTGIFYFTWAVTGISVSAGLAVSIIGIPFVIVFLASVRGLSLVEGRLVEALLGERMPRRPPYADRELPVIERIKALFTDPRTWFTLLYLLLMLPLGIVYFTAAVVALAVSLAIAVLPFVQAFTDHGAFYWFGDSLYVPLWAAPITVAIGLFLLVLTLHSARGVGMLQGRLAKHLLVKTVRS